MNIEAFPMILASGNTKTVQLLENLVSFINAASESNSIKNVEFKGAGYTLNCITENLFFISQAKYYERDLWFTTASYAKGRIKAAEKLSKYGKDLTSFIAAAREIQTLSETLNSLKPMVVKRAMRSEAELAKDYVPPIPTSEAAQACERILHELTDSLTVKYCRLLSEGYIKAVEYEIANPVPRETEIYKNFRRHGLSSHHPLMNAVGQDYVPQEDIYRSLVPNYKEILSLKATEQASFAQRMFIYKNVMKLATIVETKGNLASTVVKSGHVDSTGFHGEISFQFADSSGFTVRNKVVSKYSERGIHFLQFPTTFHNTVFSSGETLPGQPSEEAMITQFAVA